MKIFVRYLNCFSEDYEGGMKINLQKSLIIPGNKNTFAAQI